MKAYTDYPFVWLGDKEYEKAPIREIEVVSYDGDKYCRIIVEGKETSIKAGYIYLRYGRLGEVKQINAYKLRKLEPRYMRKKKTTVK